MVSDELSDFKVLDKIKVLNIPDNYGFNDPKLVKICKEQYEAAKFYTAQK